MESNMNLGPRENKKSISWKWFLIILSLCFLFSFAVTLYLYWQKYMPNHDHIKPNFHGVEKPIFYQGNRLDGQAMGEKDALELPFSIVQKWIDPTMIYDKASDSIIITTKDKVIQLKTDQLTGLMNDKPFNLRFPVEKKGLALYIPVHPLLELYHFEVRESTETGAVILLKEGDALQWGKVPGNKKKPKQTNPLRTEPSIKSPILFDLKQGDKVIIWSEQDGWDRVQLQNGFIGFIKNTDLQLDHVEIVPKQIQNKTYIPWKPIGGKINLTWEQVYKNNPDTSKLPPMPGLNVVSPQWFHLVDGDGNMKNLASTSYVTWAHAHQYQVWALFSNSFKPEVTSDALSTFDKRHYIIQQLISFAQMYQLQGINMDFENVYLKDKENVVQFVREMTPLLHEQGLVVSLDVSPKSGNEMWSKFLDRQALGNIVDYMIVMTYDEHWAGSSIAGSVASLPWVENSITRIMKEDQVPASKLIMGVPYYTRVWTESVKDGETKVSSKAVSMTYVQNLIKQKKLSIVYSKDTGQDYVEYKDKKGSKIKIWLEDAVSMKERIDLLKKYDLAGIASWSREFASPSIWNTVEQGLQQRP